MKAKRFFYHYNKAHKCLTVHYKDRCTLVNHIECKVPTQSKWNNDQPNLVIQGFCFSVTFENIQGDVTAFIN